MRTFTSRVDDIDQFTCDLNVSDRQHDFLHLSPGPLQISNRVVQLDGLVIYWNHFGARVRITES